VWKSEVDDVGMFVVVELRNDIEKAREVAAEIRKGNLKGFSIGGQAFKRVNKHDKEHGSYKEISKLELHEVTICEKGINPEATFRILKQEIGNMTMEGQPDTLDQLSSVLNRLETRLDGMEKGEKPAFLEELGEKDEKDDEEKDNGDKDNGDGDKKDDDEKKGYSDVITSEYLNWMEDTLKGGGFDTGAARTHFDEMNKAQLGGFESGYDAASGHSGQAPKRESSEGKPEVPKANFGSGGKGKASTLKSTAAGFLHPSNVTSTDLEAAYEVYKAAALEQQYKESLGQSFSNRFSNELQKESEVNAKQDFDAREPLTEIQKAIQNLNGRIDNLTGSERGTPIAKSSVASSSVEIPTTEDLANMDWGEVHRLANSVWGE
jgi:hypothetical protein